MPSSLKTLTFIPILNVKLITPTTYYHVFEDGQHITVRGKFSYIAKYTDNVTKIGIGLPAGVPGADIQQPEQLTGMALRSNPIGFYPKAPYPGASPGSIATISGDIYKDRAELVKWEDVADPHSQEFVFTFTYRLNLSS